MKLDRKQDLNVLYQVCVFWADRKNKMAALASDWLKHFRLLLWNRSKELNKTWQEARSQRPLPSLCFLGWSEKQDGRPGLWLAETFSTSPLKPLNGIQRNLTGSKILTSSTKFVFLGWSEKQDGRLASDWLRHFWLLLWNRWTEFNETWQEARSQRPLPSLCFSGRSEKQGCPGLWLAETFSTSPLKPLNRIQRNLTGSKISTSSTKFVFFGPISKKNVCLGRFLKKVAYCTQVHDMWPFGPLVIFKLLGECHCWWTREFLRTYAVSYYGRLWLIRSVLRASKCSVLKLFEILILWVHYDNPFGFSFFRHFWASLFNFLNYFVRLRITDEGSVPEMRIWSILFIKSELKWCIHLSRSFFFFITLHVCIGIFMASLLWLAVDSRFS